MKHLKAISILAIVLIAMSATSLMAQNKETRTRGAKAAYGYPTEYKAKKKEKKQRKTRKKKSKAPMTRKKSPWAG